jgi:tetratricopeptide (TPR) repeat protein
VSLRIARPGLVASASAFLVAIAFVAAAPERSAYAQSAPSASNIAAARALFSSGVKMQESGNPAGALDLFRRADSLYSAPTIQLHLAECQAEVGQLVESAETYRRLINTVLPSDASAPFRAAQTQGQQELPAVESRIPQLRVDVAPANADGLEVQIDGIVQSAALVGVSHPVNPGEHRVVATAPGYGPAETTMRVPEGKKDAAVALILRRGAGYAYRDGAIPPPPPPLEVDGAAVGSSRPEDSRFGFILGGRGGVNFATGTLDGTTAIKMNLGTGGSIGLEAGVRLARKLYLGATFEYAAFSGGSPLASKLPDNESVTESASSEYFGVDVGYMSNPTGTAGFYGEVGLGYRLLSYSASDTSLDVNDSFNFGGAEGQLGLGMTIRIGKSLLFIPKADVNVGSFSVSYSCATSTCATLSSSPQSNPVHEVFLLALGAYWDKDY